jgi:hypothetical protein
MRPDSDDSSGAQRLHFEWTYVAGLVGELVEHVRLEAPQDKGREEPAEL